MSPISAIAIRTFLKKRKKGLLIGGGVGGGIIGLLVAGFLFLIPLKIEHIVQNLESRFFGTSQSAIQNESQKLFEKYIVQRVLPGYSGKCLSTIDKNCSAIRILGSKNPITNLYNVWAQNKLENKLAGPPYNIEFQKKADGWYLKTPTTGSAGIAIGKDGENIDSAFQKVGPAEMRQAIKDETKWYQVMMRYKVGRLLEEKYGVKRCIIFCGIRDSLDKKIADQKIAAKLFLLQRVIKPRNQNLAIVLECFLKGDSCNPLTSQPNADSVDVAANGAAENPDTEVAVSSGLRALAQSYGIVDEATLKALEDTYSKIGENGFQSYVVESVLTKVGASEATVASATDAIPIAGWINIAAQIVNFINNAPQKLKKLRYVVNAAAAVQLFSMYMTYADEIHTGHVTATEVGSMVGSLGSGKSGYTGGTADATQTPLYNYLINNNTSAAQSSTTGTSTALINSVINTAYAAGTSTPSQGTASPYVCNNGSPVPPGQLVCSEEKLGGSNSILDSLKSIINQGGGVLTKLAYIWNHSLGWLLNILQNVLGNLISTIFINASKAADLTCDIPFAKDFNPYCVARSAVLSSMTFLQDVITKWLIPNPISANMSGGRTFDEMAAGADVSGNDFAHNGIGGKVLNPTQVAVILNQNQSQDYKLFSQQSMFAKLFDTSSSYSLISRIAMAMPVSFMSAETSFADFFSNPFGNMFTSFAAILNGKAVAAIPAQSDPFGVPQYGYTQNDLNAIGDPEKYWTDHCNGDSSKGYQPDNSYNISASGSSSIDPNTGMPMNTTTDPCELLMATVGSVGGYFDTSTLTSDNLADVSSSTTTNTPPPSSSAGLSNPFPGGWIPNRLDMGYDGTFSGSVVAPFSGTIIYSSSSFSNWGGYIELKADSQPSGLITKTLYFAEGLKPASGISAGVHVNAGDPIAIPAPSPYGNAYQTTSDGSGQIEWGVAVDGTTGTPTNPLAESGITNRKQMVLDFASWAEQALGVAAPSSTNSAGYP